MSKVTNESEDLASSQPASADIESPPVDLVDSEKDEELLRWTMAAPLPERAAPGRRPLFRN